MSETTEYRVEATIVLASTADAFNAISTGLSSRGVVTGLVFEKVDR